MQTIRCRLKPTYGKWDCDYKGPAFEQAEYEKGEIGDAHFKRIIYNDKLSREGDTPTTETP
jgi:hypothetical protein